MATVRSSLDDVLTAELHGAQVAMGCDIEHLLLAALGRTVARTIGEGMLVVDVLCSAGLAEARRIGVPCLSLRGLSGPELLAAVHLGADGADRPWADMRLVCREGPGSDETGPPLAVHIHPATGATMAVHWRFDTRGFDHCTVEELAEQFPLALIEVTSG